MAEKNKNQTAQERARLRELIGAQASNRYLLLAELPDEGPADPEEGSVPDCHGVSAPDGLLPPGLHHDL